MVVRGSARVEEKSLALHAAVATKLAQHPELVEVAADRVRGWLAAGGPVPSVLAADWLAILTGPRPALFACLADRGERAQQLRQCSPFAGVLDPRTRWQVLRDLRPAAPA